MSLKQVPDETLRLSLEQSPSENGRSSFLTDLENLEDIEDYDEFESKLESLQLGN